MDINSWAELSVHGAHDMELDLLSGDLPSSRMSSTGDARSAATTSDSDGRPSNWCEKCHLLKQDIEKLNREHALNYKTLKEKIINTDMLIKKYKSKSQQYDSQTKKLEELKVKFQTAQRECSPCATLQAQLKSTVADLEPYKRIAEKADKEKEKSMKVIRDLQDEVNALQASAKQHNTLLSLNQTEVAQLKEKLQAQRQLNDVKQKQEVQLSKLKDTLEVEKAKASELKKINSQLRHSNKSLQKTVSYYERVLMDWDLQHLIKKKKKDKSLPSAFEQRSSDEVFSSDEMDADNMSSMEGLFMSPVKTESAAVPGDMPVADPEPHNNLGDLDYDLDFIFRDLGLVEDEKAGAGLSLFRPISPAVSPLPPSPVPCSPLMEKLSDCEDEVVTPCDGKSLPSNLSEKHQRKTLKRRTSKRRNSIRTKVLKCATEGSRVQEESLESLLPFQRMSQRLQMSPQAQNQGQGNSMLGTDLALSSSDSELEVKPNQIPPRSSPRRSPRLSKSDARAKEAKVVTSDQPHVQSRSKSESQDSVFLKPSLPPLSPQRCRTRSQTLGSPTMLSPPDLVSPSKVARSLSLPYPLRGADRIDSTDQPEEKMAVTIEEEEECNDLIRLSAGHSQKNSPRLQADGPVALIGRRRTRSLSRQMSVDGGDTSAFDTENSEKLQRGKGGKVLRKQGTQPFVVGDNSLPEESSQGDGMERAAFYIGSDNEQSTEQTESKVHDAKAGIPTDGCGQVSLEVREGVESAVMQKMEVADTTQEAKLCVFKEVEISPEKIRKETGADGTCSVTRTASELNREDYSSMEGGKCSVRNGQSLERVKINDVTESENRVEPLDAHTTITDAKSDSSSATCSKDEGLSGPEEGCSKIPKRSISSLDISFSELDSLAEPISPLPPTPTCDVQTWSTSPAQFSVIAPEAAITVKAKRPLQNDLVGTSVDAAGLEQTLEGESMMDMTMLKTSPTPDKSYGLSSVEDNVMHEKRAEALDAKGKGQTERKAAALHGDMMEGEGMGQESDGTSLVEQPAVASKALPDDLTNLEETGVPKAPSRSLSLPEAAFPAERESRKSKKRHRQDFSPESAHPTKLQLPVSTAMASHEQVGKQPVSASLACELEKLWTSDNVSTKVICDSILHRHPIVTAHALARSLVKMLSHQEGEFLQPTLTEPEHKVLDLVQQLSQHQHLSSLVEVALQSLTTSLLLVKEPASNRPRTSLARAFTTLCRQQGDIERVRILAYEVVHQAANGFPSIVAAIASVWPDSLHCNTVGSCSPVLKVLQYATIDKHLQKCPQKAVEVTLMSTCGWKSVSSSASQLAEELIRQMQKETDSQNPRQSELFEIEKALVLLAEVEKWNWTYSVLITQHLWPVVQEQIQRGTRPAGELLASKLLRVIGCTLWQCPPGVPGALADLVKKLSSLAVPPEQNDVVPLAIQASAVDAMLSLTPLLPDAVTTISYQWIQKARPKLQQVQPETVDKLRQVLQHYQHKLPGLAEVNINF